jgi:hypothetical protein
VTSAQNLAARARAIIAADEAQLLQLGVQP